MIRLSTVVILLAVLTGTGALLYRVATGPRMYHQENIRPFEALMPSPPENAVPVEVPKDVLPSTAEAKNLDNPLAATPENIARGKTYYGYYCRFCHGDLGRADIDVGYGYMPKPTALDSERIDSMSDGELLRAMLLGTGHRPVLARIIPQESYWYIPLFVRTLREYHLQQ